MRRKDIVDQIEQEMRICEMICKDLDERIAELDSHRDSSDWDLYKSIRNEDKYQRQFYTGFLSGLQCALSFIDKKALIYRKVK